MSAYAFTWTTHTGEFKKNEDGMEFQFLSNDKKKEGSGKKKGEPRIGLLNNDTVFLFVRI
jgi:hypothetical protein